jgi:hypothetical protein
LFFFYVLECTTILAAYTLLNYDVRQMTVRKIVHIDMDAFYASVEQRDDDRPISIGLWPICRPPGL